jgi:hypothetical protein
VVVDVKSTESAAGDSRISAYIIDASTFKQRPSGLRIAWEGIGTSFSVLVNVEGSDDLERWHTMKRNASLVRLNFGGQTLRRQVIELPATDAKYMRMSWPAQGVQVISVQALFPDELSINRQVRQWVDVTGNAVEEEEPAYEYKNDAQFPIDAVNLKLPERNSLVRARVLSRSDEQSKWRYQVRNLFYTLTVDGTLIENNPVSVCCTADRYWRIETGVASGMGSVIPVLQLGWIPHELVFVARGEGPFTLAYGSAVVGTSKQPLDAMLGVFGKEKEKIFLKKARIEKEIVLGGEQCLIPPKPPRPLKQWILWAVLVAGVFLLGIMVWRLFGQMNTSGNKEQ